jgi:hypothetical protein
MRALRPFLVTTALLFAMSGATRAFAEDAPSPPPARAARQAAITHWYGWQTLGVDAGAIGVMFLGASTDDLVVLAGLGIYALGGPVVHLAHERPGTAAADLGLRVGAPLTAGLVGFGVGVAAFSGCSSGEMFCSRGFAGVGGAALGVLVGYVTAIILDAAWLACEPAPVEEKASAAPRLRWSPRVGALPRGGATVGVVGSF